MAVIYDIYVRHEVHHILSDINSDSCERIVHFIESLSTDPFQTGDYSEIDHNDREYFVRIIGKYAVYFWTDHAAKEVKVLDLVDADMI